MKYIKAMAKVVLFDNSDVVTTSGCTNEVNLNQDTCQNQNHWNSPCPHGNSSNGNW